MLTRRKLQITLALTLLFAMLIPAATASAQEEEDTLEGTVTIRDANLAPIGSNNALEIDLPDVPQLSNNQRYEGWLVASDGSRTSTGTFLGGNIEEEWVSPDDENLAEMYVRFQLTVEQFPDPDEATPGTIAFTGTFPQGILQPYRALIVSSPATAEDDGVGIALHGQSEVALEHANLAIDSESLEDKQMHAQHVINVIDGLGAPGDSIGIVAYAEEAKNLASRARAADPENEVVTEGADAVIEHADFILDRASIARENAEGVLDATSASSAQVSVGLTNTRNMSQQMIDTSNELVMATQDMGAWTMVEGQGGALPSAGDELVPMIALMALAAGVALTGGGIYMLRRRTVTA